MRQEHGQQSFATDRRTPHSFSECSPAYPEVDRVLLHSRTAVHAAVIGVGDVTTTALHAALSGLAERSRVTADNIANINTPGFLAGRTDFESALQELPELGRDARRSPGAASPARWSRRTPTATTSTWTSETVIATETGLRYQLALNALDGKYSVLRTSLQTT